MRILDLLESETSTRWLLSINGKPAAHYPNEAEAKKIKKQLTLKLGKQYKIEIKPVTTDELKSKKITEAMFPGNRDDSGRWVSRWVLYVEDGSQWKKVAHYRTEEAATDDGEDYVQRHGGEYKVDLEDVPKTKYSEDKNVSR